jgi:dCMP deaminase
MIPVNPRPSTNRPTQDETLLSIAHAFQARSTCDRNQVGAVIAREGRIISTGYNGAPAGMPHCDHTYLQVGQIIGRSSNLGLMIERDIAGRMTPSVRGCVVAIHAETNAIAYAARHGVLVEGATLYTTLSPCYACAQLIVAAGLTRVMYGRPYRDPAGTQFLIDAGVTVETPVE